MHYPSGQEYMQDIFKPCSTARLFLPELLRYDSVIHLDTDTVNLICYTNWVVNGTSVAYFVPKIEYLVVYENWKNYTMGSPLNNLWFKMDQEMRRTKAVICGLRNFIKIFTKWPRENL
ncbi:hypothetical protein Avbf_11988 [Armadillidium vulgare]|nr:hypothetical protein Avbf_11988 [Armadillidium vulgare]